MSADESEGEASNMSLKGMTNEVANKFWEMEEKIKARVREAL